MLFRSFVKCLRQSERKPLSGRDSDFGQSRFQDHNFKKKKNKNRTCVLVFIERISRRRKKSEIVG